MNQNREYRTSGIDQIPRQKIEQLFCKEYFEANWSETGSFWSKVKLSYETWYKKADPESYEENGLKGFTTEPRFGVPFLIAQLKKSTSLKTPKYKHLYSVDKKDLW